MKLKIETLYSHKTLRYVTICKVVQVEHLRMKSVTHHTINETQRHNSVTLGV